MWMAEGRRRPRVSSVLAALGTGLLLGVIFAIQARFVLGYPQPGLFGDPEGYHVVGLRLHAALSSLLTGAASPSAALESVRGVLYFVGPGAVFGALDALRPGDLSFLRLAFAAANTLAALGVFLLGCELSGGRLGGFLALLMFAAHPSFPVELAKLFPDPVTGLFLVWATLLFVRACARRSALSMAGAGAALGAALLVRSQLLEYVLILAALVLLASAPLWARERQGRRLAAAFVAGVAPFAIAWGAIVHVVGDDLSEIEALGNFTFKQRYPYGFWQFLDSDGFMGTYRLGSEPYFAALREDAQHGGWDETSRPRQWLFTARYVGRRARESLLLVLDNAFRLYDRPPNRYKWDYPYPYRWQVWFQRIVVALAIGGLALIGARRVSSLAVFFVPGALAILHGLSYPWPRFAQPALPLLLAAAGAFSALAVSGFRGLDRRERLAAWGMGAAALLALAGGALLRDSVPLPAAALRLLGALLALAWPAFLGTLLASESRRARATAGAVALLLGACLVAHTLRAYDWHAGETVLGGRLLGAEQVIRFSPEELARLRASGDAWLVLDLVPPPAGVSVLSLEVGRRHVPGSSLKATLPPLREFTLENGPARRRFPQWWALPLDATLLDEIQAGALRVRLSAPPGQRTRIAGDRFSGQQRVYDGPSFGDWPHVAAIKFDYDADSRLRVRRRLRSLATTSFVVDARGRVRRIAGVHRIRVVTLSSSEGGARWRTAPAPRRGRVAFAFGAYSRFWTPDDDGGSAELVVDGERLLSFPLEPERAYRVEAGDSTLCYEPVPDRPGRSRGAYALLTQAPASGGGLTLGVRFRSGLAAEEIMFRLDPKATLAELASRLGGCIGSVPVATGVAGILDESRNRYPEKTGRFRIDAVY
jgi:hypothetical protein